MAHQPTSFDYFVVGKIHSRIKNLLANNYSCETDVLEGCDMTKFNVDASNSQIFRECISDHENEKTVWDIFDHVVSDDQFKSSGGKELDTIIKREIKKVTEMMQQVFNKIENIYHKKSLEIKQYGGTDYLPIIIRDNIISELISRSNNNCSISSKILVQVIRKSNTQTLDEQINQEIELFKNFIKNTYNLIKSSTESESQPHSEQLEVDRLKYLPIKGDELKEDFVKKNDVICDVLKNVINVNENLLKTIQNEIYKSMETNFKDFISCMNLKSYNESTIEKTILKQYTSIFCNGLWEKFIDNLNLTGSFWEKFLTCAGKHCIKKGKQYSLARLVNLFIPKMLQDEYKDCVKVITWNTPKTKVTIPMAESFGYHKFIASFDYIFLQEFGSETAVDKFWCNPEYSEFEGNQGAVYLKDYCVTLYKKETCHSSEVGDRFLHVKLSSANLINVHLSYKTSNELELQRLKTLIHMLKEPILLAGDFNTDHGIDFANLKHDDCQKKTTCSGNYLDHIYYSTDHFELVCSDVLFMNAFDDFTHYPKIAILKRKPKPITTKK